MMKNRKVTVETNGNKLGILLRRSRWITLLGVLALYFSSLVLVFIGVLKLYYILDGIYVQLSEGVHVDTISLGADFISIIEIYLLAIIFYIFAVGIYQLFVGEFTLFGWYHVDSLDEMKAELAKAIVIFLSVFILQKIVEWKDAEHLLYTGFVITAVCAVLIWFSNSLKKRINHTNFENHSIPDNNTNSKNNNL